MIVKSVVVFVVSAVCLGMSQTPCSPKIINEGGYNSCEFLEGKSDTDRVIFSIGLTRPSLNEENTPENRANLRRWTDSLFLKYDLRFLTSKDQRALPPSDSTMYWVYGMLWIQKASVLPIAEETFVKRMSYRDKPPMIVEIQSGAIRRPKSNLGNLTFFEINGRRLLPERTGENIQGRGAWPIYRLNR